MLTQNDRLGISSARCDAPKRVGFEHVISATGALTSLGAAVAAGTAPQTIAIHPTGKFAYVANFLSSNVSVFSIDPTTGALTSIGAPATQGCTTVKVDPSGTFAYVTNQKSDNVSVFASAPQPAR